MSDADGAADDPRPFRPGDRVMLLDSKDRRYLLTLSPGGEFHTHAGPVFHDELIGRSEGVAVRSSRGGTYTAVRPTLGEVILKMPRGAQVIYPKDLGPILMLADVFPGARVLEAGVGSGALSMTLLRAGADVIGYELREDFANRARANVVSFLGEDVLRRYRVEIRDAYDGIDEHGLDRMVLDLPEPWRIIKHAETALRPGGILLSYLPSIGQVAQLRDAIDHSAFGMAETIEVLQRGWHIDGPSVRPDHRMVAHTGFLSAARLLAGKTAARGGGRSWPFPGPDRRDRQDSLGRDGGAGNVVGWAANQQTGVDGPLDGSAGAGDDDLGAADNVE